MKMSSYQAIRNNRIPKQIDQSIIQHNSIAWYYPDVTNCDDLTIMEFLRVFSWIVEKMKLLDYAFGCVNIEVRDLRVYIPEIAKKSFTE
jgi:hypothetical protein